MLSKGLGFPNYVLLVSLRHDLKDRGNRRLPPSALVSFFSPAGISVSFLFSTPLEFLTAKAEPDK